MTNDLDNRIASLEAKRRSNSLATVRDAEQVVGELHEAVRQASLSVGGLNARTDLIDERASALEQRIRKLWVLVVSGVAATFVATVLIVAFVFWSAARVKAAAENEVSFLREAYKLKSLVISLPRAPMGCAASSPSRLGGKAGGSPNRGQKRAVTQLHLIHG